MEKHDYILETIVFSLPTHKIASISSFLSSNILYWFYSYINICLLTLSSWLSATGNKQIKDKHLFTLPSVCATILRQIGQPYPHLHANSLWRLVVAFSAHRSEKLICCQSCTSTVTTVIVLSFMAENDLAVNCCRYTHIGDLALSLCWREARLPIENQSGQHYSLSQHLKET